MHHRRATVDVGLGGIRVYSDAELAVGTRLEIDLVRDGHEAARCWVRVAWIETLSPAAGAAYDIGLEFTDITDEGRQALGNILTEG